MTVVNQKNPVDNEKTYELAIVAMTRAEKRQRVLGIMFEEGNFTDLVTEYVEVMNASVEGLLCHGGFEPLAEAELSDQLREVGHLLDPRVRGVAMELASNLDEIHAWRDHMAGGGKPPGRIQAAQMIDWATQATHLIQRVLKDDGERW